MKQYILAVVLSILSIYSYSNTVDEEPLILSDSAYITLFTCDPGAQLYSAFGHSAIGVFDPLQGIFVVFNYGTFSFNVPHFYIKFARGKLNYRLSVSPYQSFIHEYQKEGRMVLQEELNLTQKQKQQLFDALVNNYKPENREYLYDFFFDNCATRIVDMVENVLGDSLVYNTNVETKQETLRNMIDDYLDQGSWSDVGIDLALGAVIDKIAPEKQKTFLPNNVSQYMNNCRIGNKPLIKSAKIVVPDTAEIQSKNLFLSPTFLFWSIFTVILLLSLLFRRRSWVIVDRIIFTIMGLLGLLVLFLWFATDHTATANNWNILWANPLYLLLVFFISDKNNFIQKYLPIFLLLLNITVIVCWNTIPQQYNFSFLPIIGMVCVRLSAIIKSKFFSN